ncbi:MAG: tRNA epoxyqueuosine(34) reductase QueG [Candidatus Aureabacteria bacterium]|nr:tRNA epoxyqueuosine(34) reductase QueG [Candidatus Auribacterota bacterium]
MKKEESTVWIKKKALEAGFDLAGITGVSFHKKGFLALQDWLDNKSHGSMKYMERSPENRADPAALLSTGRSIIMLGTSYFPGQFFLKTKNEIETAFFALFPDYHHAIRKKMTLLIKELQVLFPGTEFKSFVDSSPILEKAFAQSAGLGFIGKNTLLINENLGSYLFLSGILTSLELVPDSPVKNSCGSCKLCLKTCPTGALEQSYYLKANKCLSYQTIEQKGMIPRSFRPLLKNCIWGCDLCQRACPYNQRIKIKRDDAVYENLGLKKIFSLSSPHQFEQEFRDSVFFRGGRNILMRNACIAAGNLKDRKWLSDLRHLRENENDPLIREAAGWAISQIKKAGIRRDKS